MIEDCKEVKSKTFRLPLLFLASSDMSLETISKDHVDVSSNVLNEMTHSDVFIVRMREMGHADFSALLERLPLGSTNRPPSEYSQQDISESYGWMAKYALAFLNAELKHDSDSGRFLRNPPAANGVPRHLLALDFRPGTGFPPTLQALATLVGKRGFNHLNEVYLEAKARDPELNLSLQDLDGWGEQLVRENHLPEAIEVLKLTIAVYPSTSWYPYQVLSKAYVANNQKDLAITTLRDLLQKDPANEFGKTYLKELETAK
jgi:tetratricopeptide (TPR) repeat protein